MTARSSRASILGGISVMAWLVLPTSIADRRIFVSASAAEAQALPDAATGAARETCTIRATARLADGTVPRGAQIAVKTTLAQTAEREPARRAQIASTGPALRPADVPITGSDGDWVIRNAKRGTWSIEVFGDDLAWTQGTNVRRLELETPVDRWITFVLEAGGTVTGRVVRADTGEPIEGARVLGPAASRTRHQQDTTDGDGRFAVGQLPEGRVRLCVESDTFVTALLSMIDVKPGEDVTVPDVRLHPGGWVSGRIEFAEGVRGPDRVSGGVRPLLIEPDGPHATGQRGEPLEQDGSFRVGPIAPGGYRLEATVRSGKGYDGPRRWEGRVEGIQVRAGEETTGVAIAVAPADE